MSATTSRSDDSIVGINVTPLVDITLVLLIIFMVTAKLIARQSIPLDLPKAATAGATQTVFNVSLDPDAHVLLNGASVADRAALQMQARGALAADPSLRVFISASARVSHGSVMAVVDALREIGIGQIAFAAEAGQPSASFGAATQGTRATGNDTSGAAGAQ
ncbi:MAG TPA: biopolymer transporter ExbD [Polyangiaceae bacterium]|nr:biopolymer transporter ExbD [Polyangiaceae bacterium]